MKTFPYMDGDRLIELVERCELDAVLAEAVKRMEDVPVLELNKLHFDAMDYGNFNDIEAVRTRLIQAAKGEQP